MALEYSKIKVNQFEVDLKNKPQELLQASPKATVPVLQLDNNRVIDESLDIMLWALKQYDPDEWLNTKLNEQCMRLIYVNDSEFKPILDKYKYVQNGQVPDRDYYRNEARVYLNQLKSLLMKHTYLLSEQMTLVDVALFPFIRQFYMIDQRWFEQSEYTEILSWLQFFLNSDLFQSVMRKKAT